MKLIRVYNVSVNSIYVNATIEYKNFWGKTKIRDVFYRNTGTVVFIKYKDTNSLIMNDTNIHCEILNTLEQ